MRLREARMSESRERRGTRCAGGRSVLDREVPVWSGKGRGRGHGPGWAGAVLDSASATLKIKFVLEEFGVREVRADPEVVGHAIVDWINVYVRDVLAPRCPALAALWEEGPAVAELNRLKYEVAAAVAARWTVTQVNDDV